MVAPVFKLIVLVLLASRMVHGSFEFENGVDDDEFPEIKLPCLENQMDVAVGVDGFSSGALFSMQFFTAFSCCLVGLGVAAGGEYGCAVQKWIDIDGTESEESSGLIGKFQCLGTSNYATDLNRAITKAMAMEKEHKICPLTFMKGKKGFVYHGKMDSVVKCGHGPTGADYLKYFGVDVETFFPLWAEHNLPTACDKNGYCWSLNYQSLSDCDFSFAARSFNTLYQCKLPPNTCLSNVPLKGELFKFSIDPFLAKGASSAKDVSMDQYSYIYVPSGCLDLPWKCGLHIHFHGCLQAKELLFTDYIRKSGYLEAGESCDKITLFPQAAFTPANPSLCWFFFNLVDIYDQSFLTQNGGQMATIFNIIDHLLCDDHLFKLCSILCS